jgi:hypothetical protein
VSFERDKKPVAGDSDFLVLVRIGILVPEDGHASNEAFLILTSNFSDCPVDSFFTEFAVCIA